MDFTALVWTQWNVLVLLTLLSVVVLAGLGFYDDWAKITRQSGAGVTERVKLAVQFALAAFIAVGIPVLGFLIFGRSFWGSFLIIASVVLLTLLLAPEAYTAIGLAFASLILAALAVTVAGRSRAVDEEVSQLAAPTR